MHKGPRMSRRIPVVGAAAPVLVASALLAGLVAGAGCGLIKRPDMTRQAMIADLRTPPRPVILLHGFLGSKLRDSATGKVVWGKMSNVLMGGDSDMLALALDGDDAEAPGERVEAFQIYDSLWGVEYYREILRSLRTAGGYQIGDMEDPNPGDNAFVFVYDWRRDNVETARLLAEAIDRLKARVGLPDLRFDLLTHSQGGLVARYYLMYGGAPLPSDDQPLEPTMEGAANVEKVIMFGTPNRGCLEALKILHLGVKKIFRPIRPEIVFTMPSVFEMLPPRGSVLFADEEGNPLDLDLYDPRTWIEQEWSVFARDARRRLGKKADDPEALEERLVAALEKSLHRADLFQRAIDAPLPTDRARHLDYYAFGSDCINTLKTAIVTDRRGKKDLLFDDKKFRDKAIADRIARVLYGPGDGTVLMQSLLDMPDGRQGKIDFNSAFFVCETHGVLPNDPIFQNNLLYVLLWSRD